MEQYLHKEVLYCLNTCHLQDHMEIFLIVQKKLIGSLSYELAKLSDDKFLLADDRELAKATAHAVRYKDLAVTDIVINNDPEAEKQFGAITILLPNNTLYISYLGTDDMLFSWKEDFNMTFMDTIPSQIDGLAYLNHIAEKFPKYKMLLGGHSKGGNIAMFAALSADKSIQERIISIDNFDGPGFDQDRAQFRKNPEISAEKLKRVVFVS